MSCTDSQMSTSYIVYRNAADPTSLDFFPPKESDELFDALRAKFPYLKSHSERMRDAIIEFFMEERATESMLASSTLSPAALSSHGTSQNISPWQHTSSSWSTSTTTYDSPETSLRTPSLDSPCTDLQHSMSADGSPPALEGMTSVFSLTSHEQPKQRLRRKMTEAEKVEYRKRRIIKACEKCAKRKRKCTHNQQSDQQSHKITKIPHHREHQKAGSITSQVATDGTENVFDPSFSSNFEDFTLLLDDKLPELDLDNMFEPIDFNAFQPWDDSQHDFADALVDPQHFQWSWDSQLNNTHRQFTSLQEVNANVQDETCRGEANNAALVPSVEPTFGLDVQPSTIANTAASNARRARSAASSRSLSRDAIASQQIPQDLIWEPEQGPLEGMSIGDYLRMKSNVERANTQGLSGRSEILPQGLQALSACGVQASTSVPVQREQKILELLSPTKGRPSASAYRRLHSPVAALHDRPLLATTLQDESSLHANDEDLGLLYSASAIERLPSPSAELFRLRRRISDCCTARNVARPLLQNPNVFHLAASAVSTGVLDAVKHDQAANSSAMQTSPKTLSTTSMGASDEEQYKGRLMDHVRYRDHHGRAMSLILASMAIVLLCSIGQVSASMCLAAVYSYITLRASASWMDGATSSWHRFVGSARTFRTDSLSCTALL